MHAGRSALGEQSPVAQLHRGAGGQHRVAKNQGLALEAGRREVFDENVEIFLLLILAVGRDKGVLSRIEIRQETLVERHSGAENGAEHHLLVEGVAGGDIKRSLHLHLLVFHCLGNLVCHYFTGTFKVTSETQGVTLHVDRAHLQQIAAHQRRSLVKIYNFHLQDVFVSG